MPTMSPQPLWWPMSIFLGMTLDLLNHMCVLAIAMGDGTLFDADSLQEEDIVALVKLGQAHLKGVVQLLAMELVFA